MADYRQLVIGATLLFVCSSGIPASQTPVPEADTTPLRVERGVGELPLLIPRNERLVYGVVLDLPVVGESRVGSVVLSAGVEPFRSALPVAGADPASAQELGWLRAKMKGKYLSFRLEQNVEVRALPQEWPHVIYRDDKLGSKPRRKELRFGTKDGKSVATYRRDHHCKGCKRKEHFVEGTWPFSDDHHCKDCDRGEHRVWKDPRELEVPDGTIDTLSAIYLARSMSRAGIDEVSFPLMKKSEVWELMMARGRTKEVATPAGRFLGREFRFSGSAGSRGAEELETLFGMEGTIHVWLDEVTGVPVLIEGTVPVAGMDVDASLALERYEGTPADFGPRKKKN